MTMCLSVLTLSAADKLLKNGDFSILDSTKLPVEWNFRGSKGNDNIVKKDDDGTNVLQVTIKKTTEFQGFIITAPIKLEKNTEYELSGNIKSSIANMAFLQVKLYKSNKEIKRFSSQRSGKSWTKLSVKFNNADSDYIQILLRFNQTPNSVNQSAWFKNIKLLEAPKISELSAVPLFQTCSLYLDRKDKISERHQIWFREQGSTQWQKGFPLVRSVDHKQLKGSLVNLKENTDYEVKLITESGEFKVKFKTWNPAPPIKKTITLNEKNFKQYLKISQSGSNDGWIKYIAEKDFILKGSPDKTAVIDISGAKYVILEGLTVRGGVRHGINISDSKNIRILNCDIAGWGRIGTQRFDKDGKYYMDNEKRCINNDAAVNIDRSQNVVVERCYAHDPRGTANSWTFSHPAGPNAIAVRSRGGTVVRYNDFIGSDIHRWNDCIEGHGNGKVDGGFYRDASIYGNMFAFGNDDGIELDGGQMNIRLFYNKIEGFYCGVSTAPCLLGPSYVFRNLIVNLGDEYNACNFALKNIYSQCGSGRIFFFNNTIYAISGFSPYNTKDNIPDDLIKGMSRNNILYCRETHISPTMFKRKSDFDYDLIYADDPKLIDSSMLKANNAEKNAVIGKNPKFTDISRGDFRLEPGSPGIAGGTVISGFAEAANGRSPDMGAFSAGNEFTLPYRPIPVYLDRNQLNFDSKMNSGEVVALVKGKSFDSGFKVVKNSTSEWLSIEPSSGRFKSGSGKIFTVKVNPEKMFNGLNKAVFLIRLDNGFSRPVTVYANKTGPLKRVKLKGARVYIEAEAPSKNPGFEVKDDKRSFGKYIYIKADGTRKLGNKKVEYKFNIPEDGNYYILMRIKGEYPLGEHDSIFMAVNSDKFAANMLRCTTSWKWSIASGKTNKFTPHFLKRGVNTIKFSPRESIGIDQILVAKAPWKVFLHDN